MSPRIGSLPANTKGFDCNTTISRAVADKFYAAGYRFAVRYVRRGTPKPFDLSVKEIVDILGAGLALSIVQHVAMPGWMPTAKLGQSYGAIAANEASLLGYPVGGHLWLDLEGVDTSCPHQQVKDYCNEWWDAVAVVGYEPGLYVGDSCGLTAQELYSLKFTSYWGAYNVNSDQTPAVRGYQMKQHPYPVLEKRVKGVPFEYDTNTVLVDAKGGTPRFLLP